MCEEVPVTFSKITNQWYLSTALYDAIDDGNISQVAKLVLEKHANPNTIIPDYGMAALHFAAGHENENFGKEVTKLLLKYGADPNIRSGEGWTPLHVAAAWNRGAIVRVLLSYGADTSLVDDQERTALYRAYEEAAWDSFRALRLNENIEQDGQHLHDDDYRICLDKVIVNCDDIQAEYKPVCDKCKYREGISTRSVATQASLPIGRKQIVNMEDLDHTQPSCEGELLWCDDLSKISLSGECKQMIIEHRSNSKVFEHDPTKSRSQLVADSVDRQIAAYRNIYCPPKSLVNYSTTVSSIVDSSIANTDINPTEKTNDIIDAEEGELSRKLANMCFVESHESSVKEATTEQNALEKLGQNLPYIDDSFVDTDNTSNKNETKCEHTVSASEYEEANQAQDKQAEHKSAESNALGLCGCVCNNESDSSAYYTCHEPEKEVVEFSNMKFFDVKNQDNSKTRYQERHSDLYISDDDDLSNVSVEYKYVDRSDGTEFIEAKLPLSVNSSLNRTVEDFLSHARQKTIHESMSRDEPGASDSSAYDTDTIKSELKRYGFKAGPMVSEGKKLYLRKLRKMKTTISREQIMEPPFSPELSQVMSLTNLNWERILSQWSSLEDEMRTNMEELSGGSRAKTSFTYLLLDPHITNNLPARCVDMDLIEVWQTFLQAVFYVGKGTNRRPYQHLHEAFAIWKQLRDMPMLERQYSQKVGKILSIWKEGKGVVCVQAFHHLIAAEAFTREAAMIEAVGLARLKNDRAGRFYGKASQWRQRLKRRLGSYLLYRAMRIFISDNEIQLKPTDLY